MDNVQKHNIFIDVSSSQAFRSYSLKIIGVLTEIRTEYLQSTALPLDEPGRSHNVMRNFFLMVGWDWVHLVRRPLTGLLYQPRMIDDEFGAVNGMRIGRGNRSTPRKPTPVPLCLPQIPHDLTCARTGAAAVGCWQLTAWAMARPLIL
jgi:hypothetical protein